MHKTHTAAKIDSQNRYSIISPVWDFIFVGGLTFIVWPFVTLIQHNVIALLTLNFSMYAATFFLNGPHFFYSYQVMYSGFMRKISADNDKASRIRYFFSGVVVPIILMLAFAYAYFDGVQNGKAEFLGYVVNVMLFFVGWHYVKQGYGVLITLSVKKRIFYSAVEKKIFLYNGYIIWIATWIFSNGNMARAADTYFDIPFMAIPLVEKVGWLPYLVVFSSAVVMLIFTLRADKGRIAINAWVGYICALYVWTGMIVIQPTLILVIPALHSLQYMLFVGKLSFEKGRERSDGRLLSGFVGFIALGIILSSLCFWGLPSGFNHLFSYDRGVFGPTLFLVFFLVFTNIHHYFIDFAIWRKDNPEMKYLYY